MESMEGETSAPRPGVPSVDMATNLSSCTSGASSAPNSLKSFERMERAKLPNKAQLSRCGCKPFHPLSKRSGSISISWHLQCSSKSLVTRPFAV
eukprot:3071947-Rhodomonas_salina.2